MFDPDELDEVVFVFEDGKAVKTVVETGISDFDRIEILSGLKEGQSIISGPFLAVSKRLEDGEEVDPGEDTGENEDSSESEDDTSETAG